MIQTIRALAHYLPQYHSIPENDFAWGEGFTEWCNVVKGKQVTRGQYQPHVPSELGYYSLLDSETREKQARMAKESGIHGFVYYHYWFNGKRLLERPFNEVLESGKPDFPFCLCWANENWSKLWNGGSKEVIIEQKYSLEDDLAHIRYLCSEVFTDNRYIKVNGKPLFIIYRSALFPNIKQTIDIWREEVLKHGFPGIYLINFWSFGLYQNPVEQGFDASALFAPNSIPLRREMSLLQRALLKLNIKLGARAKWDVYKYNKLIDSALKIKPDDDYKLFPSVTPGWDNYVRRELGGGKIFIDSTPDKYRYWLTETIKNFIPYSNEENFIFINAWNEWAEGNHLEPCIKWGNAYLNATKKVLKPLDNAAI